MKALSRMTGVAMAALVLGASPASAQIVNYTTTGAFSGCTGAAFTASFSFSNGFTGPACYFDGQGGQRVAIGYQPANSSINTPSNATFGSFLAQSAGPSTISGDFVTSAGFSFTVNQTAPSVGNATVPGNVAGTITVNSSNLFFTPTGGTANWTIGVANYTLFLPANGSVAIVPPTSNQTGEILGETTLQGRITSTVPEPGTYALMASGLAALAFMARRRRSA